MTDRPTTQGALAAIDELQQVLGWLASSLLPGTAKPYTAPQMSEDARAARAMEDRHYRQAAIMANTIPLGESPAPLDLSVMDLLSEILVAADDMAMKVARCALVVPMVEAASAFADPGPYLQMVHSRLATAAIHQPNIVGYVEEQCDALVARGYQQLGIFGDGQVLRGAVCPWCDGRTEHALRGEATWRVKAVLPKADNGRPIAITELPRWKHGCAAPNDHTAEQCRMAVREDIDWFVVCWGLNCTPPSKDCGTWIRGRPAWNLRNEDKHLTKSLESGKIVA